MLRIFSR